MISTFGEETWRDFLARFALKEPYFAQPIMPVAHIPARLFLDLNDAMLHEFFHDDSRAYWTFGEKSAEYALTEGQLRGLFATGEFGRLMAFSPNIWKSYYSEGELTAQVAADGATLSLSGVPIRHVHFEFAVMGFAFGGLKVLGAKAEYERVKGFSANDDEVVYRFKYSPDPARG